ncbi:IclR family transcriptional regulator C-terminal domain-containing protein [Chelativorans sp. AA-79]|uniref:IclR family transcriptional regulator domain-containing protein n=1 Tax=Chelativorans sp. AA-79 TaxID=3028735 RepID=UPI0023F8CCF4|nr:IclR family transcriptional regulator C-terminal domain-containing protein [Chelativorans sp. AA-79]WEX10173.1 IclR family transcriptional regulator C-terminal domain-containing protein [Chelativorans sp. AA-79]
MSEAVESTESGAARSELVGSLAKGLGVLQILAGAPSGLRLTEVAEAAGLTRAGARRLLLTLVAEGYVRQEGRQFLLTAKMLSLSRTWLGATSGWSRAEPVLREVSQAVGESCSAAVLEGEDVVYVARVAGRRIVSVSLSVGTRLPAYCTSMGRVLLSGLDDAELACFLDKAAIRANTPKTVTDRQALAARIADVRRAGYAIVDEELELGLRSIAVPVRARPGAVVAAINVSTQAARFSCEEMGRTLLPPLLEAAAKIEDILAFQ